MVAPKARKSAIVPVRFSPDDLEKVSAVAATHGMKVSAFVRQCALVSSEVAPFVDNTDAYILSELQEDLRKIGINLNQIARAINSGRHPSKDEIQMSLDSVGGVGLYLQAQLKRMLEKAARVHRGDDEAV